MCLFYFARSNFVRRFVVFVNMLKRRDHLLLEVSKLMAHIFSLKLSQLSSLMYVIITCRSWNTGRIWIWSFHWVWQSCKDESCRIWSAGSNDCKSRAKNSHVYLHHQKIKRHQEQSKNGEHFITHQFVTFFYYK